MSGYGVLAASHGRDAIRVAAEYDDGISLMVTDVIMPGMERDAKLRPAAATRPEMKSTVHLGIQRTTSSPNAACWRPGTAFLQSHSLGRHLAAKVRECSTKQCRVAVGNTAPPSCRITGGDQPSPKSKRSNRNICLQTYARTLVTRAAGVYHLRR